MDKYNNEFEACDKLKLKPGFGEFYGGNQIHITRQNDKQMEKSKYKPFEGSGNLLNKKTLSNTSTSNTRPSKSYQKNKSYSKSNHYNRQYKNNVNNIKKPIINYTNINDCNDKKIKTPPKKQIKNYNYAEINISKPNNISKSDNIIKPDNISKSDNRLCVFLIILSFFYICYLLHLANQKLYYYTGYKF